MPFEELMRQFAVLLGRALARRWLRQRGLLKPSEGNSDPTTGAAAADSQSPPATPQVASDCD